MDTIKVLSDIEHVLARPGMYLGSIKNEITKDWKLINSKMEFIEHTVNKGLLKCFDEILSNSIDEHKRNGKINKIVVKINTKTNEIIVWDNGGIPVRKHSELKDKWIPEIIFSILRSGANFNDDETRTGTGTHGVGSVLVNIYSKKFKVETNDTKNNFIQIYENNLSVIGEPKISRKSNEGYTQITFTPDLERFGLNSLNAVLNSFKFRFYEACACNSNINFELYVDGVLDEIKIGDFKDYTKLYVDEFFYETSKGWNVGIGKSDIGFNHVSYVNSTRTYEGGTHIDLIINSLVEHIRAYIIKKHKTDVKPSDIKNHIFLTVDCIVDRPEWGTQTKDKLISKNFIGDFSFNEKTIKAICNSEIVKSVLDWIEKKKNAEDRKKLRDSEKVKKIDGLIDAKNKDRTKCILYIFEGESAISAVRKLRNPEIVAAYPLRGKFINVFDLKPSEVVANNEAVALINAIGLKIGEKVDFENIKFGKIVISVDSDVDGISICASLITFFAKYWFELFEQGYIYRAITPLYVAKNKSKKVYLYNQQEYEDWLINNNNGKWEIYQKKGLAALEDEEYSDLLNNPKLEQIKLDQEYKNSLDCWFGKDSNKRKTKILK